MRLMKEQTDTQLFKTIQFDNMEEKLRVSKIMEKDDWEDLEKPSTLLKVTFRKHIEGPIEDYGKEGIAYVYKNGSK